MNLIFCLDFSDNPKRDVHCRFLLNVDEPSLQEAFDKTTLSLVNILKRYYRK